MNIVLMRCLILTCAAALAGVCAGAVLLDERFADGSRGETELPKESAVWVSHPDKVATTAGSLAFTQLESSSKMWTYFAAEGAPVTMAVGDMLTASIAFRPRGQMSDGNTSRNFRFGIFHDPTDGHMRTDTNTDSGGNGDPWKDATGYAVQLSLSTTGIAASCRVGKRVGLETASLLGSDAAYSFGGNGGRAIYLKPDSVYVLRLSLERVAAHKMNVIFRLLEGENVLAAASLIDSGVGSVPIYTAFDQLFLRMNNATGTAEVLEYQSITVEHNTERRAESTTAS